MWLLARKADEHKITVFFYSSQILTTDPVYDLSTLRLIFCWASNTFYVFFLFYFGKSFDGQATISLCVGEIMFLGGSARQNVPMHDRKQNFRKKTEYVMPIQTI